MIGRIGFLNPEGWPEFEIGWTLRKSAWGKGFATEAARASLRYAFEDLDRLFDLVGAPTWTFRRGAPATDGRAVVL